MGVGGQRHALAAFTPGERPGTHCTGVWVGPRSGLDGCGKSRPHRDSIPRPSSRSESLYRLSYPGSQYGYNQCLFISLSVPALEHYSFFLNLEPFLPTDCKCEGYCYT